MACEQHEGETSPERTSIDSLLLRTHARTPHAPKTLHRQGQDGLSVESPPVACRESRLFKPLPALLTSYDNVLRSLCSTNIVRLLRRQAASRYWLIARRRRTRTDCATYMHRLVLHSSNSSSVLGSTPYPIPVQSATGARLALASARSGRVDGLPGWYGNYWAHDSTRMHLEAGRNLQGAVNRLNWSIRRSQGQMCHPSVNLPDSASPSRQRGELRTWQWISTASAAVDN
ncbi:uncharacterized protein F5Z01DRAFT_295035 [Emericellopsis atlantica]|uniref:Uncharacterized protein n=1 Tax=Emericellopsis atlantica TaxID=2614577 RepID=A0A9P8CMX3_9HYPO|nr:uncharacterized protein F5Z01DRAFT_295035 [Emericellopsis atlantica]KAG9251146.1 hypothetical protein F5Z01DRAFT_295035 [Emericellopsis atlantica]